MKRNTKADTTSIQAQKRIAGHLETINLHAAGIDIGSGSHFVAVPKELDEQLVREFPVFTADLENMAKWLVKIGVTTVVMESTGVYWIPAFEMLEAYNLKVHLVNARHVKNVAGRKTDVQDCQWLQQLHTYRLLRGAFRPEEQVCALRTYKKTEQEIEKSLHGHYREEHLFTLQQAVELFDVYDEKIKACDRALEKQIKKFDDMLDGARTNADLAKKHKSGSSPCFDVRSELHRVTGVDLTAIDGVDEYRKATL